MPFERSKWENVISFSFLFCFSAFGSTGASDPVLLPKQRKRNDDESRLD